MLPAWLGPSLMMWRRQSCLAEQPLIPEAYASKTHVSSDIHISIWNQLSITHDGHVKQASSTKCATSLGMGGVQLTNHQVQITVTKPTGIPEDCQYTVKFACTNGTCTSRTCLTLDLLQYGGCTNNGNDQSGRKNK